MSAHDRHLDEFLTAHMAAKANRYRKGRPPAAIVRYYTAFEARASALSVDEIMSKRRTDRIAFARFRIWRKLRSLYGYSTPGIGLAFGMDHTSVVYGLKRLAGSPTKYAQRKAVVPIE